MLKRKGAWILLLPVLSLAVTAGIVGHQYSRRSRLRVELKAINAEYERLSKLLPEKFRQRLAGAEHRENEHDH